MRLVFCALLASLLTAPIAMAQSADTISRGDKTFLTRRDLVLGGAALGTAALISIWDDDVAETAVGPRFNSEKLGKLALRISKVNETTLTAAGILTYGIARLSGSRQVADVALHTTEAVVLASLASQVIRGPLGRTRPHVTGGKDQYHFQPGRGFREFDNRAFPSIHTSSAIAVATALTMETYRRKPEATPYVGTVLFAAGILPGLSRIQLNQHWASDIFAGAFMGALAGYKVVKYSHDHPTNRFDKVLLRARVMPGANGDVLVGFSPF